MRDGASSEVLAGAFRFAPRVASWKGVDLLAESVPILGGDLTADASQEVPEVLKFRVPAKFEGVSWVPNGDPQHPLAEFGQFVDVAIDQWSAMTGLDPEAPPTASSALGRFLIQDWFHDKRAGVVRVECVGMLQRPKDAGFRNPQVPRPGATFVSEARRLMSPGIPVIFDPALVDRAVPQSMVWGEDRLQALYMLADAWPALLRVDASGSAVFSAPVPASAPPVMTWTDGEGGTVVSAPTSGTRDGIANVVVARSTLTDDPSKAPLQQIAEATGALHWSEYGEKLYRWSSPLAATNAQLLAAAQTILARKSRGALVRKVSAAPDHRVELDDPVAVLTEDGESQGFVTAYRLPLTLDDGAMTVDVGVS